MAGLDDNCRRSISYLIGQHAAAFGQTSPHAEDLMRRQLQDGVMEEKQAVILGEFVAVHDAFQNQYPECKVSFDAFCRALPWNALEASQVADGNISCSPHGCFCSQCLTDGTGPCLRQGMSGFRQQATQRGPSENHLLDVRDWAEQGRVPVFASQLQSEYWSAAPARRAATRCASTEAERRSTAGRRFHLPADVENQILALC